MIEKLKKLATASLKETKLLFLRYKKNCRNSLLFNDGKTEEFAKCFIMWKLKELAAVSW
jgi:hypothetical protein